MHRMAYITHITDEISNQLRYIQVKLIYNVKSFQDNVGVPIAARNSPHRKKLERTAVATWTVSTRMVCLSKCGCWPTISSGLYLYIFSQTSHRQNAPLFLLLTFVFSSPRFPNLPIYPQLIDFKLLKRQNPEIFKPIKFSDNAHLIIIDIQGGLH